MNRYHHDLDVVGTKKVQIISYEKCGSSTLSGLAYTQDYPNIFKLIDQSIDKDVMYIYPIRDIMGRWKSGWKQEFGIELEEKQRRNPECGGYSLYEKIYGYFDSEREIDIPPVLIDSYLSEDYSSGVKAFGEVLSRDYAFILDSLTNEVVGFKRCWHAHGHANYQAFPLDGEGKSLNLMEYPNVYFIDLKQFSNRVFKEWLLEQDQDWGSLDLQKTRAPLIWFGAPDFGGPEEYHDNFWINIDLFFEEWKQGKICKGMDLVSPFHGSREFDMRGTGDNERAKLEQLIIDDIRKHPRYLDFEFIKK
jgi:hypothetical protein